MINMTETFDIKNDNLINITIAPYIRKTFSDMHRVFLENEFNSNIKIANENMKNLEDKAHNLIRDNTLPDDNIKITHKVWLTNNLNPFEPDAETQRLVKEQYINLPNYKHIFWSNVPKFCENFIVNWGICNETIIEVRDINEFDNYYANKVYKAYMNQNLFAVASDIVRLQVICKYGGIYSDMGFSLKNTLPNIIKNFNIVINGENFDAGIVSHNILSSKKPQHILYTTILNIIDKKTRHYYKLINNGLRNIIDLAGPQMLTAAVSTICKEESVLLILNNQYTCDRYHNGSWFGEGKYGSTVISKVNLKKFEEDLQL